MGQFELSRYFEAYQAEALPGESHHFARGRARCSIHGNEAKNLSARSQSNTHFSLFFVWVFFIFLFFWGATFVEMLDLGQIITVRLAVVPVGPIPFLAIRSDPFAFVFRIQEMCRSVLAKRLKGGVPASRPRIFLPFAKTSARCDRELRFPSLSFISAVDDHQSKASLQGE